MEIVPQVVLSTNFLDFLMLRFWLFEPRCGMHDIGGWYIETFGRDKKGRLSPSQRYWDGFDARQQSEK